MAQQSESRIRLEWDKARNDFKIPLSLRRPDGSYLPVPPTPTLLSRLPPQQRSALMRRLDTLCRRNQMVFHGPFFVMDAIFRTVGHLNLSPTDVRQLRAKAHLIHKDFQHRFLWSGLLHWCSGFVAAREHVLVLAQQDLKDPVFGDQMRTILRYQICETSFRAIWAFCAHHVNYHATFTSEENLAFRFVRFVFEMMAPLMFRIVASERLLNAGLVAGMERIQDADLRTEAKKLYQALTFAPELAEVGLEAFIWVQNPPKKSYTKNWTQVLDRNRW